MKPVKSIVVLFILFTVGCVSTGSEQRIAPRTDPLERVLAPVDYSQFGSPPIPVKILLMIPYEFERFVHVSNYQGRRIRHSLGMDAELELRDALGIEFSSLDVWPVSSETRAIEMLSPGDPENSRLRSYDYVAIPRFLRVDSLESNERYGFEIDLQVEFNAKNGSRITIKGHGESMIGKYAQSTPEKGAVLTLQHAVFALLDGIEKRRNLFER